MSVLFKGDNIGASNVPTAGGLYPFNTAFMPFTLRLFVYKLNSVTTTVGADTFLVNTGTGSDVKITGTYLQPQLTFSARGDDLTTLNANTFGWNFIDNLGTIEASYAGQTVATTLSATTSIPETGGTITYTATIPKQLLDDATITLANGEVITILAGAYQGSANTVIGDNNDLISETNSIVNSIASAVTTGVDTVTHTLDTVSTALSNVTDIVTVTVGDSSAYENAINVTVPVSIDVTPDTGSTITVALSTGVSVVFGDTYVPLTEVTSPQFTVGIQNVTVSVLSVIASNGTLESFVATDTGLITVTEAPMTTNYSYDGATTVVLGERYLVDSISAENILLKTNTGIKLDGSSQHIFGSFVPDTTGATEYTVIVRVDTTNDTVNNTIFGSQGATYNEALLVSIHGLNNNGVRLKYAATVLDIPFGSGVETLYYTVSQAEINAYRDKTLAGNVAGPFATTPTSVGTYIGASNLDSSAINFCKKQIEFVYVIPTLMVKADIDSAIDNIERLLYLQDSDLTEATALGQDVFFNATGKILRSDYLSDTVLVDIIDGKGFGFAFTENTNCNGEFLKFGSSTTLSCVNWTPSVHTNAVDTGGGYQNALITQDINGSHTGLATIDVQADTLLDAQTQFTNENGLTLTDNLGQWEITK